MVVSSCAGRLNQTLACIEYVSMLSLSKQRLRRYVLSNIAAPFDQAQDAVLCQARYNVSDRVHVKAELHVPQSL